MDNFFLAYFEIVKEVDEKCDELAKLHAEQLQCKAGCDSCCMAFDVLPIEFYAIKQKLSESQTVNSDVGDEGCHFLIDSKCAIYANRPIICRTQGLPLLYMGEENWELSVCELNFTRFDFDTFNEENTFSMDRINSKLYMLNQDFLKKNPSLKPNGTDLIPIKNLLSF